MKQLKSVAILIFFIFSTIFSDFPSRHSLEFSLLAYRFSYSEEFEKQSIPNIIIKGTPRSDEYGLTAGSEIGYKYYNPENKLSFGAKFNYSRSVNHTYDGSSQGEILFQTTDPSKKLDTCLIYWPVKIENKDNYFHGENLEIGYSAIANSNVNFKLYTDVAFNGWIRPIGLNISEKYYWLRINPGISVVTKNSQGLGVISELSFSIPVWETMILPIQNFKFKFDIDGKVGWRFEFGFIKYLVQNRAWKVLYFHEYYGFKQSPDIYLGYDDSGNKVYAHEPSSGTSDNGVKISFEFGFGGK
ncbi:MAG: hypothetical protein LBH98_00025 [Chitinispirillales bacterium]|jgi:hypothetical protein|nr:hypothetical protein [Chitinispirillales bacterium]